MKALERYRECYYAPSSVTFSNMEFISTASIPLNDYTLCAYNRF